MEPLPPIPSPFGTRWRRVQWKIAHTLMFLTLCTGVVLFWRQAGQPAAFVGQVETIHTVVSSRDAGFITNLWVVPMQQINLGDLVAEVVTTDPRTVNNRLEVIRDRLRLISLEMEPILSRQRTALAYEQLALDSDRVKGELGIARVKLEQARTQLARDETTARQGVLSTELLDLSRRNKEAYEVEVFEKSNLVQRTEKSLERLKTMSDLFVPGGESDPIKQAIEVEEDKARVFEAKLTPLRLTAPDNGIVTTVHRHVGEQILAGEPIATITSTQSVRIIGYLGQHHPVVPRVGLEVEVRTRGIQRRQGKARILGVGPDLQPLTNSLVVPLALRPSVVPSLGRVVTISLPDGLELLPGEPVDLSFPPQPR